MKKNFNHKSQKFIVCAIDFQGISDKIRGGA